MILAVGDEIKGYRVIEISQGAYSLSGISNSDLVIEEPIYTLLKIADDLRIEVKESELERS